MSTWVRRCLSCGFLGDSIFGQDWDEVLAFETKKVVRIRDRSLGILWRFSQLSIFVGVVIFQILYAGKHFKKEAPHSIQRVTLQPPVSNSTGRPCNPSDVDCSMDFTSVSNLKYCEQYDGERSDLRRLPCEYFDSDDVFLPVSSGMLLTSFTKTYLQRNGCPEAAKQGKPCPHKWVYMDESGADQLLQVGRLPAQPITKSFVADLERFTILIDHSVRSESGEIAYDDGQMQGYFEDCEGESVHGKFHRKDCTRKSIRDWSMNKDDSAMMQSAAENLAPQRGTAFVRGRRVDDELEAEEAEDLTLLQARRMATRSIDGDVVVSTLLGDVLSVGTLLRLAGLSFDQPPTIYSESKDAGKTVRSQGTAIVVNIEYKNHKHWTFFTPSGPPEYDLSVSSRPVAKFKHTTTQELEDGRRRMTDHYGIFFEFEITGELCVFTYTGLMLILTTSVGLLAVATFITDSIAIRLLPDKDEYKKLKFESSRDFHTAEKDAETPEPSGA